jgi:hypothetical protein
MHKSQFFSLYLSSKHHTALTNSVHTTAEIVTYSFTKPNKCTHKNKETDPVSFFIYYITQKIICNHPQSSPLLSVNTAAYDDATIQSNGVDHFL